MIQEIRVKSALHKHPRGIPCGGDLNIYRGCGHCCRYCFAQYSHAYLNAGNFFDNVFVKTNIVDCLEKELGSRKWKKEMINIGGVTDSYQPVEARCRLMPGVLDIAIRHSNPILIATKSTLPLRDINQLASLAERTTVDVAVPVTTLDEPLREKLEPGASPAKDRLLMLKQLKDAGCNTSVLLMPVLPFLTDSDESLASVFEAARDCKADGIVTCALNLKGKTRAGFFKFLKTHFRDTARDYERLYETGRLNKEYNASLQKRLAGLKNRYGFRRRYDDSPAPVQDEQLSLFDDL